jgi:hypothetical protein
MVWLILDIVRNIIIFREEGRESFFVTYEISITITLLIGQRVHTTHSVDWITYPMFTPSPPPTQSKSKLDLLDLIIIGIISAIHTHDLAVVLLLH